MMSEERIAIFNCILFCDQLIHVDCKYISNVSPVITNAGSVKLTRYFFEAGNAMFYFSTRKNAERMRNKLIDMLARAKAQLLLEEVGSNGNA